MNLATFIETFQEAITRAVLRTYPPLYTARNRNDWGFDLRRLRRRPLGAQGDAIRAVALSLQRHRGTNLVGEMGTGKTTIAAVASQAWRSAAVELRRTASSLWDLKELVAGDAARLVNVPALLVQGRPGTGKTHLLCHVARGRCDAGQPTVVLLGQWFSRDEPWAQVLRQLGLDCGVDEFLGALNVAAEVTNSRALIFVDALNEGEGLDVWPQHLHGFLEKLRWWPRLGVAMSCRISYLEATLPEGLDGAKLVRVNHEGFAGHEYEAVRTFFERFQLILPDFPLMVPEFQNPLFLKLLCEGLHAEGVNTVPRGSTGVTRLFGRFLALAERRLSRAGRCDYPEQDRLVRRAVDGLAEEMLERGQAWVPFEVARELTDRMLPNRGWSKSLLNGLLSEGVLFEELIPQGDERARAVFFAYQRLGDHRRAAMLCERLGSLEALASRCQDLGADSSSAYRHSGLLEALAVQVPERWSRELHEIVPDPSLEPIQSAFLESLIWRDLNAFPAELPLDYLNRIPSYRWGDNQVLATLLQVACVPDHPFNARILHSTLWRLSMADRDSWWSIFLHWNSHEEGPVTRMIEWAWSEDTSYCAADAALLCATTLAWYLTASNRFLRDRATKALVSLLESRLTVLVDLLERFKDVNDLYVAERLYAVAYGCCLVSADTEGIARVAAAVYGQVFADGCPPEHILLRDHAQGVIERALQLGCNLPDVDEARLRPPYQSKWPVRAPAEKALEERYLQDDRYWPFRWSLVSIGDFRRYVVEHTVEEFLAPGQSRKIASARREAVQRAAESWRGFVNSLTEALAEALARHEGPRPIESILTTEQRQDMRQALADYEEARSKPHRVPFDAALATRWIFARVLKLGWTPKRFLEFDRAVSHDLSRTDHRSERIGKKYQWIALHQLLSRIADHCRLKPDWNDDDPRAYKGAWQLSLRDIDPSMLLRSTEAIWGATQRCWWASVAQPVPSEPTPEETETWLRSDAGLPPPAELAEVTDRDGRHWLALEGHYEWQEEAPPEVDPHQLDRCRLWYQIRSYLVRRSDLASFSRWAEKQNWMGRWMPESHECWDVLLGEYPWHPSVAETIRDWETVKRSSSVPAPVVVTSSSYRWEGRGYDYSLDGSVSGLVPSPFLIDSLSLSWRGQDFRYVNSDGRLTAWDPSARERGPHALLIDKEAFARFLEEEGLSLVWTVLGEKQILGERVISRGRFEVCGAMVLEDDAVRLIALSSTFVGPRQ